MEDTTFDKSVITKLPFVILGVLGLLTLGFGVAFYKYSGDAFYAAMFSGVSTGLFVSIIQFIITWYEHNNVKRLYSKIIEFEKMGISKILPHRDNEEAYRNRVANTKKMLLIMGHTANRFIDDFANMDTHRTEKKVLLSNLANRKYEVKILIPDREYIDDTKQNVFDDTLEKMRIIRARYNNFQVKYFQHTPTHSIFLFDNECLLGPIFPKLESKDTPTLQASSSSEFSEQYLEYFEDEWEKAISIDDK